MANQKSEKSGDKTTRKPRARAKGASAATGVKSSTGAGQDPRQAVIDVTLELAAERGWAGLGLRDIARASGLALSELHQLYPSKTAILADFTTRIDTSVLARLESENGEANGEAIDEGLARDRLFDVIMTRLELLQPYKAALRAIFRDAPALACGFPKLLKAQVLSRRWMLAAADIGTGGPEGALRSAGLGMVYARTLRVWLKEEDPAMPRTMAELDRLLNRGEKTLRRLEGPTTLACSGLKLVRSFTRQARDLCADYRRDRRDRRSASTEASV